MSQRGEKFIASLESKQEAREKLEELQTERLGKIVKKLEKGKEAQYLTPVHESLWKGGGKCKGAGKKLNNIECLTDVEILERGLSPFTPKISGGCDECNKTYVYDDKIGGLVDGGGYKQEAEKTIEEAKKMRKPKKPII